MKKITACAVILLLSACGGGGGGGGGNGGSEGRNNDESVAFETLLGRFELYENAATFSEDDFDSEPEPTAFAELPADQVISYTGLAIVSELDVVAQVEGEEIMVDATPTFVAIGSATTRVDFSTTTFDVTADNFYEILDLDVFIGGDEVSDLSDIGRQEIEGKVAFAMSQNPSGENSYLATTTGELTKVNDDVVDIDVTGGGYFTGPSAAAIFIEAFEDFDDRDFPEGVTEFTSVTAGATLVQDRR